MNTIALLIIGTLLQNASLDSASPKERRTAIEQQGVPGNAAAVPAFAAALKKEPQSEIRAEMLVALVRIHDRSVLPVIAETLKSDLDKDVRLQAVDAFVRYYIQIGRAHV